MKELVFEMLNPVGRWGHLHGDYLKERYPSQYNDLLSSNELWNYLNNIDRSAQIRYELLVEQLKESIGITEETRNQNHNEWMRKMNSVRMVAEETVMHELIFQSKNQNT